MDLKIQEAVLHLVKNISKSESLGKAFGDIFVREISSRSPKYGKSGSVFLKLELTVKTSSRRQGKKDLTHSQVSAADEVAARSSGNSQSVGLGHTGGEKEKEKKKKKKKRVKRRERDEKRLKDFIDRKKAATEVDKKRATKKAVPLTSLESSDRKKKTATMAVPSCSKPRSEPSSSSDTSPPLPRPSGRTTTTTPTSSQARELDQRGQKDPSASLPQTPHLTAGTGKKVQRGTLPPSSGEIEEKKGVGIGKKNPSRKKKGKK